MRVFIVIAVICIGYAVVASAVTQQELMDKYRLEKKHDSAVKNLNECQAKLREAQVCECSGLTMTWYDEVNDVVSTPMYELITNLGEMTPLRLFVVSTMTLSTATMVNLTFRMLSFRG
jgi:hypothetical protein